MPDQTETPRTDAATPDLGERPAATLDDPTGATVDAEGEAVPTPDESEDFGDPRASLAEREEAAAAALAADTSSTN